MKGEKKNGNCFMSFILSQQISCKAPEFTSTKPPTRVIIIIILYRSFPFISTLYVTSRSLSLLLLLPYYHNIYLCLYKNIPFHFSIFVSVYICVYTRFTSLLSRKGKKIIHKKIMRYCAGHKNKRNF